MNTNFIEELKDEVRISFAHTTADYEIAKKGLEFEFAVFDMHKNVAAA